MRRRGLGLERKAGHFDGMILKRTTGWLLCCCLLLTLAGCGNKGPLELPDDEQQKKSRTTSND